MSYEQEVEFVQNDYGYDLEGVAEYKDANGVWQPVDLTGASSVVVIIAKVGASTAKVVGACTVTDAVNGLWKYPVVQGDFDVGDVTYEVNLKVTYATGQVVTCRGATIYIKPALPQTE